MELQVLQKGGKNEKISEIIGINSRNRYFPE
jgi:hypothetical protein